MITIIGILAAMVLGGLNAARNSAREAKTKATIAKINEVLMRKYDSYLTRRVPIDTTGLSPQQAATARLQAIRKLMAMEMPDRFSDFQGMKSGAPVSYGSGTMPPSALAMLYDQKLTANPPQASPKFGDLQSAKCLYLLVMTGSPESRELFKAGEYADICGDKWPVFLDGWDQPIKFIREPKLFCSFVEGVGTPMPSDIQTGDPVNDHDPFDPLNVEANAYRVIPLVYSAGNDKLWGLNESTGAAMAEGGKSGVHYDNIHNHQIEQQ